MVVGDGSGVLVVGAGPAGSSAAMLLTKAGVPVVMIEREVLPRRKPCGGLVSLRALKEAGSVLESDGFPYIPGALVERVICGVRVMGTDTSEKGMEYWEDDPIGVMVDRSAFDFFLAKRAVEEGAALLDGFSWSERGGRVRWKEGASGAPGRDRPGESHAEVSSMEITTTSVGYSTRCSVPGRSQGRAGRDTAKVIIGADGTWGPTAKTAGIRRSWRQWELGFTLSAEINVGTRACDAITGADRPGGRGVVEFHCLKGLVGGFGWVFPRSDTLSVGVGGWAMAGDGVSRAWRDLAQRLKERYGVKTPSPAGCLLPAWVRKRTVARVLSARLGPGRSTKGRIGGLREKEARMAAAPRAIILVGDAAGLVDPFSGEGLLGALSSARLAAEAVTRAIKGTSEIWVSSGDEDVMLHQVCRQYTAALDRRFETGLRGAAVLAFVTRNPSLRARWLLHRGGVRDICRIMRGEDGAYVEALEHFRRPTSTPPSQR